VLAEPRRRRVEFLERVIGELGLTARSISALVTELPRFRVEGVITRALESVSDTLSRVRHFLPAGGRVLFLKGPGADRDLDAIRAEEEREYAMESDRRYTLPGTAHERRLLIYTKKTSTIEVTYRIFKNDADNRDIVITSPENRQFKDLRRLVSAEGARKSGRALVSGRRLVRDIAKRPGAEAEAVVVYDGYVERDDAVNSLIKRLSAQRRLFILKKNLYNELDIFGTGAPLLVLPVSEFPEWDHSLSDGCTLLVPFQDPVNVGTAVRSAVAFGVRKIIILKGAAHPYHPKSVRSSGGAVFSAEFMAGPSIDELAELCGEHGIAIVALDRAARRFTRPYSRGVSSSVPASRGRGFRTAFAARRFPFRSARMSSRSTRRSPSRSRSTPIQRERGISIPPHKKSVI
jgi:16S rRNA (guanine527-N7)-methyltransferase